jgi:hypothetical protein
VAIPSVPGKITRKKLSASTYIYYEYSRKYDREKKFNIPRRACIGKQDPSDESRMFPNEKYHDFFPSEIEVEHDCSRSSCLRAGSFLLIREFAEKLALASWLQGKFGSKDGGLILDLASYMLIAEKNAAQHYPDYAYNHPLFTPDMRIYSDTKVGTLFKEGISRDDVIAFTEWWNDSKDHRRRIYISYDSTNKISQAGDVELIEGGHAKDGPDGSPIVNISIATDVSEGMPLFYEDYCGSIVDISQFEQMVEKAEALGYRNIGFILDRGYFSKANIADLDSRKYSFLIMVKGRKSLVASLILGVRGTFEDKSANTIWEYAANGTTVEAKLYGEDKKTRCFHIYYSAEKYASERSSFETCIKKMAGTLDRKLGRKCDRLNLKAYGRFFDLTLSNDEDMVLLMYSKNNEAIDDYIRYCGYYCLISSEKMTAREALLLYKSRDYSEKLFSADKTFTGSNAERIQSVEALRSKIFIEFIALILRSRLYHAINSHVLATGRRPNYMNVVSVLSELEKIELIRIGDGVYHLDHAITARQKDILSVFALGVDDIKDRCRTLSQTLAVLDNRNTKGGSNPDPDVRNDSTAETKEV